MKKILLILLLLLLNCKNDSEKVISLHSGDTTIHFQNQFKRGGIKDSLVSIIFDKAFEQTSKKNYKKARKLLQEANSKEPNNILITNSLGSISAYLSEFEKSFEYYKKSLKIDSSRTITYIGFGVAYNLALEFDKSISILK